KKIVLIDEPELSLSLEWQEHVLVDIVNSPSVTQMLAITHSPFVFNNELKSQVTSLKVIKH
ncbi:TPA: AAA family ATPase, partial [Escherichia coli]